MNKSDYLENLILNAIFGGAAFTLPATVYLALFTSAPGDAGGGTEVTGGAYARAAITRNTTNFPTTSTGSISNAVAINFAQASTPWGTVTHAAIMDAASGGNILYYAPLTAPRTVATGETFGVAVNGLTITEA